MTETPSGHHRRSRPNRWLRFWHRPKSERRLALQALALCLLSLVALKSIGFQRWKRILLASSRREKHGTTTVGADDVSRAIAIYAVIGMVARNVPWDLITCLPRSLTLWWLLRRRGIGAELRIGVRKDGEVITAHAWVVCRGEVVGDGEHGRYEPFESGTLANRIV
jgi:Transglutaminase-like superfamily